MAPRVPSRASSCSYVRGSRKLAKKVEAEKYLRVGRSVARLEGTLSGVRNPY